MLAEQSLLDSKKWTNENNYVKQQKIYFIGRSYVKEAADLAQKSIKDVEEIELFSGCINLRGAAAGGMNIQCRICVDEYVEVAPRPISQNVPRGPCH